MLGKLTVLECKEPGVYGENMLKMKQKLELYKEERFRGALLRASAEALPVGETPTQRSLRPERVHAQRKNIEIMYDGVEATLNKHIRRAFTRYYE